MRDETIKDLAKERDELRSRLDALDVILSQYPSIVGGSRDRSRSGASMHDSAGAGQVLALEAANGGGRGATWERIRALMDPKTGYSPKEIHQLMADSGQPVSLPTVYTTLKRKNGEVFLRKKDKWYRSNDKKEISQD